MRSELARTTPVHKRRRFVGLVKDAKSNQIGMETAAIWGMLVITLFSPRPVISFTGDYSSWGAAAAASRGYNSSLIFEKVRASALLVKCGDATFERDSVTFHHPEFRRPLLACILHAALHSDTAAFHVIDFGGSLGSTY